MTKPISQRQWEALSAYLDGELNPKERERLEGQLRSRIELQESLDELRRTRQVLRKTPRRKAPRNFTLTPSMVGSPSLSNQAVGWFTTLRFSSALASLLLVLVLLSDFIIHRTPAVNFEMAAAPAPAERSQFVITEEVEMAEAPQAEALELDEGVETEAPAAKALEAEPGTPPAELALPMIAGGGYPAPAGEGESAFISPEMPAIEQTPIHPTLEARPYPSPPVEFGGREIVPETDGLPPSPQPPQSRYWRIVEVGLALLALLLGAGAFIVRRAS